jgi:hypothetical protein
VHLELPARTKAHIGVHLRPGLLLETVPIAIGESGLEKLEPELPLSLFELLHGGEFFLEAAISQLLCLDAVALISFRGVDIPHTELCEEKPLRVLDGFSASLLSHSDAGIRHIQEVLQFVGIPESIEERHKGPGIQLFKRSIEDQTL